MPELPEVETVLRTLERQIEGRSIKDIRVLYPRIIEGDEEDFRQRLTGRSFRSFLRRGKYLLFEMDDVTLVCHLRMEGKFYLMDPEEPVDKHTHVIFSLSDGRDLRYHDVRKFGRMEVIEKRDDYQDFKGLGPEPFDKRFNRKYCKEYLKGQKRPVKEILLDQGFCAGIGNIYADEILYASKIHPLTKGNRLNEEEISAMITNTRRILKEAVKAGGTTIRSYTSSLGVTGRFQMSLRCHDRDTCPDCGQKIEKIRVGGRGTYYCPKCQERDINIAITGTIGSGKSTAVDILRKKGYDVFVCDEYNAYLLEKGNAGYLAVKEAFPKCFDGEELDKKKLAGVVFRNRKEKAKLEGILHPLIIEEMKREMKEKHTFFAEVPLLYECGLEGLFDSVVLVTSKKSIALQRLQNRGIDEKEGKRRLRNQMSSEIKKKLADEIIYNNGSLSELEKSVTELIGKIIC